MKTVLMTLLLLATVTANAYDFKTLAENLILPGYQQLQLTTNSLNASGQSYCDKQSKEQLKRLRNQFRSAFLAWQSMQPIRFGPIQYLNREHRFQMWPDKRGSVGKHLRRLLQNTEMTDPGFDISSKSVAVQGFSALERLLFSDKPIDSIQCKLIVAITDNLKSMSSNLLDDWKEGDSAYVGYFSTAARGNDIFESDTELAGQILNSLYTQLEFMVTQKLDRPLGASINKARGKRAEGWRSQTALTALKANLEASRQIYLGIYAEKLGKELAAKIDTAFQQSAQLVGNINQPLKTAVTDEKQRPMILELRSTLSALKGLIGRELANELNLSLGFNSLDGD